MESTRGKILDLLRTKEQTVNELAAALGLTDNAVRAHLLSLLEEHCSPYLAVIPSYYGMHVSVIATRPLDCEAVSAALRERDIMVHALDRYYVGPVTKSGFIISYATADLQALDLAVRALAEELRHRATDSLPRQVA